ncbi:MAG TPA: hypothetical protein VNO14_11520 [Blastocatellia bacterium]|nr:hypothetical protein [Blastocatellia bacterium]
MSESARSIDRFKRRVLLRKQLLSLQDHLAIAAAAGGLLAAASVFYVKLRPLEARAPVVALVVLAAVAAAALGRWLMARAGEEDAAFEIDRRLGLEDRIATASSIMRQGGPSRGVEEALLEDAASRIKDLDVSAVAPYRFQKWYIVSLLGVAALAIALIVPQKALPEQETLLAERADIQSAGEQLEQTAKEVEQFVPPETVTASLAKEQADLGRALRRSTESRSEALTRLSELEGRIRERHDELAATRADEIVSLAEKRLRSAIASNPAEARIKKRSGGAGSSEEAETAETAQTGNPQLGGAEPAARELEKGSPEPKAAGRDSEAEASSGSPPRPAETGQATAGREENRSEPGAADGQTQSPRPQEGKATGQTPAQPQAGSTEPSLTPQENQQKPEADQAPSNPLAKMAAEQAARAAPALSEELLKKAAQMRAGDLKPEDIQRLAKAAEALARDLAPIAQSKEFQQQLQQLAQKIDPEQLERVARELLSQESIRKELEAAARLLAQNRQAREIAAGLARQFGQGGRASGGRAERKSGGAAGGSPERQAERPEADSRISGRGREDKLTGKLRKKDGGEYLFLQSRPDAGTARVPYSSAYPRYRREAERSVERSQIPPNMRKVVRSYFDAINPDSSKKQ